jgi:hypothetical protein
MIFNTPLQLLNAYKNGFIGSVCDKEGQERLLAESKYPYFGLAAQSIAGSGKGKTALLFKNLLKFDPKAFNERQTTGDCVSHAARNAVDTTRSTEIINGDKESFIVRSATEGIYGVRGHTGQGMTCERAVRFLTQDGGILLRKKYGSHDLSVYNGRMAASWGRSGTPRALVEEAKKNQVKTASNIRSIDEARDALFNGYGIFACSNLGFSEKRDKNGIAQRSGNWAHAMAWIAMDDTREIFNETLFLIQNSWGPWNSGPKRFNQPDGSFWVRQSVAEDIIEVGSTWALSSVDGFPAQKIKWSLDEVL